MALTLRNQLVETALQWQERYGVAPSITTALSEYDAAVTLLGMSEAAFEQSQLTATAVQRGYDFVCDGVRYQIKANRPSGRPGSKVTLCAKARNYDWDRLIWILYNREYCIQEAWEWDVSDYAAAFDPIVRISPAHMRMGNAVAPVVLVPALSSLRPETSI
ncbi:hypothetical protein [Mesorhizobium sp. M1406]|uniref:hypothetical protein n=1 Tax=Mesorhizobium sp. M1406 TaxID=2957099 RepID=UPI00333A2BC8